jgi:hypothetical protein
MKKKPTKQKTTKRPWRPRAQVAWTPGPGMEFHGLETWGHGSRRPSDEPVRIIPEVDYQRLLRLAGLKEGRK